MALFLKYAIMGITFDALAAKKLLMAYFLRYGKYEGADMDCKTAQMMVTPYINRELKDRELEEFIDHIRDCKECYEELEIYFTIHFALRKLDEDKDVSFNIQKMLQDDLRLSGENHQLGLDAGGRAAFGSDADHSVSDGTRGKGRENPALQAVLRRKSRSGWKSPGGTQARERVGGAGEKEEKSSFRIGDIWKYGKKRRGQR